jgi:chromosome segregation ATPase
MATEQAEAGLKKTNDLCDKLLADNTQLKLDLQNAESKLDVHIRRQATDSRTGTHWSTQIVELKKRVEDLTTRSADHPREMATKQAELDTARQDLARANSRIDDLQARREDERGEHRRTRDDEKKAEENNVILRKEATIRQKELDQANAKLTQLQEDYEKAREERDNFGDSLRVLQGRLDILKALGAIHIEDFQGMAHTNMRVAGAIENLATSIRSAPHPPGPSPTAASAPFSSSSSSSVTATSSNGGVTDRERKA